jgi:hypothetical protein
MAETEKQVKKIIILGKSLSSLYCKFGNWYSLLL